ncbi:acyl carrier protein [Streptomyces rectiverticillatus]|uniref:acyl carrier protein n=1 Tax=Streptomyces rectiverticillatus TaxID=173860 RepID=UPI0015C2C35D|nr:acyl carrier protein [Streptomyces rectiverticillatus]
MNEDLKRILTVDLQLDDAALRPGTSLEDAGIDSLSVVELSVYLSEQLGLEISEEELQSAASVDELDRMVEQRRRKG